MSKIISNKITFPFIYGTLEKLSDDKFKGKHPNNINEGYTSSGVILVDVKKGYSCVVGGLRTSIVTKIISKTKKEVVFKTLNSTYKLIYDGKR